MSTATEIIMLMNESARSVDLLASDAGKMLHDLGTFGTSFGRRREVCAKRARKLRRRGENVRYCGLSKTGKPRFYWTQRVDPTTIYLENP
jgi:hypothetical protein